MTDCARNDSDGVTTGHATYDDDGRFLSVGVQSPDVDRVDLLSRTDSPISIGLIPRMW